MRPSVFDVSGFVAKADVESDEWRLAFRALESDQTEFLSLESRFRSQEYRWPRDPLHTWSRIWEYPYVHQHIKRLAASRGNENLHIVDYGSGVTFFPFAVAKLGCHVTCLDIDPICVSDMARAISCANAGSGSVRSALIEPARTPIEPSSCDVVYCISVLEHIPDCHEVVDQIARLLRPRGLLILTIDIDLRGNSELGVQEFTELTKQLDEYFVSILPERSVHPAGLLTNANSPYHARNDSLLASSKQIVKSLLQGHLIVGDPRVGSYLGVYASVLERKCEA